MGLCYRSQSPHLYNVFFWQYENTANSIKRKSQKKDRKMKAAEKGALGFWTRIFFFIFYQGNNLSFFLFFFLQFERLESTFYIFNELSAFYQNLYSLWFSSSFYFSFAAALCYLIVKYDLHLLLRTFISSGGVWDCLSYFKREKDIDSYLREEEDEE